MSVIIAGPTAVMLILVASLAPGRRARVALPLATCVVQPEVIHEVQKAAEIDRGVEPKIRRPMEAWPLLDAWPTPRAGAQGAEEGTRKRG